MKIDRVQLAWPVTELRIRQTITHSHPHTPTRRHTHLFNQEPLSGAHGLPMRLEASNPKPNTKTHTHTHTDRDPTRKPFPHQKRGSPSQSFLSPFINQGEGESVHQFVKSVTLDRDSPRSSPPDSSTFLSILLPSTYWSYVIYMCVHT